MPPQAGLHVVDWVLIVIYSAAVIAVGVVHSRKQKDSGEYYTGDGNMSPMLIGVSLFVTLLSTISYLAQPGEIIKHGPTILCGQLGAPITFLIVGFVIIPRFMRSRVTSAYELLEAQLGLPIRLLGASLFLILRMVWMTLMIYLTSKTLTFIIGLNESAIPLVAAGCGLITIVYTSFGGIRTVVVTDFAQSLLLLFGALLTLGIITIRMKGVGWFPTEWVPTWDHQPLISFDPEVRVTVVGSIFSVMVWQIATAGGDQTAIQRYMSTRDAPAARRSYLVTVCCQIVIISILTLVGFALLGYFSAFSELLPGGMTVRADADMLFPLFISSHLPTGVTGLVVVALFAAAMSSLDSGLNSVAAVVQTDFIDRLRGEPLSPRKHLWVSRLLSLTIGVVIVIASGLMAYVPGNFMEVTQKTTNLLVTPIFGLFFLALFVPFARPIGAVAGCLVGIATAVFIGYWDVITGEPALSFQWIGPTALVTNLTVACSVSWVASVGGNRGD